MQKNHFTHEITSPQTSKILTFHKHWLPRMSMISQDILNALIYKYVYNMLIIVQVAESPERETLPHLEKSQKLGKVYTLKIILKS